MTVISSDSLVLESLTKETVAPLETKTNALSVNGDGGFSNYTSSLLASGIPPYLPGADLTATSFAGQNLSYATLSNANLYKADLSQTVLKNAYLQGSNLSFVLADGADFSNANLYGANLSDASLSYSDLSGAALNGTALDRSDLSNAVLANANLNSAVLHLANLSGAKGLDSTNLSNAVLNSIRLEKTDVSKVDFGVAKEVWAVDFRPALNVNQAKFENAPMDLAIFSDLDLSDANFKGASLRHSKFDNTNLSGANLSGADLSGADLYHANLTGSNLSGAVFDIEEILRLLNVEGQLDDRPATPIDGASFDGADLRGTGLGPAMLEAAGASYDGARFD